MKRNSLRDFWCILILCYSIIGLTIVRAEEMDYQKIMVLVNDGRTQEAIGILRQEIDKNPQQFDAHLALGVAYLESGDYASAKSSLEKALAINGSSVPSHYTLAMLYEKERNIGKSISEWRLVLQLSSDKNLRELANKHIRQLEGIK
jgi:tetratricopeptide (TPR) repeat protein